MSDGRSYTYTWSARGQLLAEYTHGYPVRTFTYDGAGRLTQATVFTRTTRFTYHGLGDRLAVEVVGQGTTTYTLDLATGSRILAEETLTGTVRYLYGRECVGEQRDGQWLYYLADAEGLVRQGVNAEGEVVSAWLFDPDGVVLEGPEGPVSHLVCGGVYDWSTGLIYKGGRYFDPTLGIWLALMPLVVVQSWRGRKRQKFPWAALAVLWLVGASGVLTACGACKGPSIDPPSACTEIIPFGPPLGDNAVFAGPTAGNKLPEYPEAMTWDAGERQIVEAALTGVIGDTFGGPRGWSSLNTALAAFGVSVNDPIILVRERDYNGDPNVPAAECRPYLYVYDHFFRVINACLGEPAGEATLTHEMAHYWDRAKGHALRTEMQRWINWGDTATHYAEGRGAGEDLAEAVRMYFWAPVLPRLEEWREWTDDMGAGRKKYWWTTGPDQLKMKEDQLVLSVRDRRPSQDGTIQVQDRYDWVQMKFGKPWLTPYQIYLPIMGNQ